MTSIKQSAIYWKVFDTISSCREPLHFHKTDRLIDLAARFISPEKVSELKAHRASMSKSVQNVNEFIG